MYSASVHPDKPRKKKKKPQRSVQWPYQKKNDTPRWPRLLEVRIFGLVALQGPPRTSSKGASTSRRSRLVCIHGFEASAAQESSESGSGMEKPRMDFCESQLDPSGSALRILGFWLGWPKFRETPKDSANSGFWM